MIKRTFPHINRIEIKLLFSIALISFSVFLLAVIFFFQFSNRQLQDEHERQTIFLSEYLVSLADSTFNSEKLLLLAVANQTQLYDNSDTSAPFVFSLQRNGRYCTILPSGEITYSQELPPHNQMSGISFTTTPHFNDSLQRQEIQVTLFENSEERNSSFIPLSSIMNQFHSRGCAIVEDCNNLTVTLLHTGYTSQEYRNSVTDSLNLHFADVLSLENSYSEDGFTFTKLQSLSQVSDWHLAINIEFENSNNTQRSWMYFFIFTLLIVVSLIVLIVDAGVRSTILKRLEILNKILNKEWVDGLSFETLQTNDEIGELVSSFQNMSQQIQRKVEMEQLIAGVSRYLAEADLKGHFDSLEKVLRKLGIFAQADRSYLFLLSDDATKLSLSSQWSREGIPPFKVGSEILHTENLIWLIPELRKEVIIKVTPLDDLPRNAQAEYKLWNNSANGKEIQDLIIIPLFIKGVLSGFMAMDAILNEFNWNHSELHYLTIISESIGNAIEKYRTTLLLEEQNQQLLQAQKMETVGRLAGGIAHDFNNILAGIVSSTSLFITENRGREIIPYDELTPYLDTVETAGERAVAVVQQLLSLSRKQEYNFTQVDIYSVIQQILSISKTSFDKRISIEVSSKITNAITKADPIQIEQVLLNFVMNSVHAMTIMRDDKKDWGGKLVIGLEHCVANRSFLKEHPIAFEDAYWKVSITDTGIGIAKENYHKIFEPFYTTKDKGIGTGLGLSMVYRIIQEHYGFVEFESQVGKGTTFNIYLPQEEVMSVENETPEIIKKKSQGPATILVVDDEPLLRKIATRILTAEGHTVLTAENGGEAVDIFTEKADEIDAVVLDLIMPIMGGDETYHELIKIRPDVKVLISSGFRKDERVDELIAEGVAGFLQKPYSVEAMKEKIIEVLG